MAQTERNIYVEYVDIDEVEKWPRNPKDHDLHELKKSFHRFGFVQPVLVDEGTKKIVAGHGRVDTLKLIRKRGEDPPRGVKIEGDVWKVPVLRGVEFDDPAEAEAYLIADNRLNEIGGWDKDILSTMLGEVVDIEGALDGVGFDIADVMKMVGETTDDDEDEMTRHRVVKTPEECQSIWEVKQGDIYKIGEHKIGCGDCRDEAFVLHMFGDDKATGVVTSPPYANMRRNQYGGVDDSNYSEWFFPVQEVMKKVIKKSGHFILNIGTFTYETTSRRNQKSAYTHKLLLDMVEEWGWCFIDEYCWPHSVPPRIVVKKFRNAWEPVYWFTLTTDYVWYPEEVKFMSDTAVVNGKGAKWGGIQGSGYQFVGDAGEGLVYPSNVLKVGRVNEATGHPASYPLGLPKFFMQCCSKEGEVWYDPFLGSGTSMFAAESIGRVCYGTEILPEYVSLILEHANELKFKIEKIGER